MLYSLTESLFRTHRLSVPYVGSFTLHYVPARLDFADRLLHAPSYDIAFSEDWQKGDTAVDAQLLDFGKALQQQIKQQAFHWTGLGKLEFNDDRIVFQPEKQSYLSPVAANKIIRENSQHAVLVGEREMHSGDTSYITEKKGAVSYLMLIGWIILGLAILFIGYYLYKHHFAVSATGSQVRALLEQPNIGVVSKLI